MRDTSGAARKINSARRRIELKKAVPVSAVRASAAFCLSSGASAEEQIEMFLWSPHSPNR